MESADQQWAFKLIGLRADDRTWYFAAASEREMKVKLSALQPGGRPIFEGTHCKVLRLSFSVHSSLRFLKIFLCHPKTPCFFFFKSKITNLSPNDHVFFVFVFNQKLQICHPMTPYV